MSTSTSVVPAHLSFLAIYNPSLGRTDETFRDQIVFYYSRAARDRRKGRHNAGSQQDVEREAREEENEKLRQIGLAQGMVDFARGFAEGQAVDHVDTEKSRIVMKEVEDGWWMLASIALTKLPAAVESSTTRTASPSSTTQSAYEYSSREVAPPTLLLQQLLRAHRIFKLHHGPSLSGLYVRLQRTKFCHTLERYWTRFTHNWDALLHGNPTVDTYHATKLSAAGELGIGVGEEEWGSGEREVFEDFAARTDGLVDMVVSRFGSPSLDQSQSNRTPSSSKKYTSAMTEAQVPWLGRGIGPGASDGVVFSGTGGISRQSLCDVSDWVQQIYTYGDHAYGVRDNPGSDRRKRRRKEAGHSRTKKPPKAVDQEAADGLKKAPLRRASTREYPSIPPPIVSAVERSLDRASSAAEADCKMGDTVDTQSVTTDTGDKWTKYLTLGYGSSWGLSSNKRTEATRRPSDVQAATLPGDDSLQISQDDAEDASVQPVMRNLEPEPEGRSAEDRMRAQMNAENNGHFIIGLKGHLDEDADTGDDGDGSIGEGWNSRTLLRTLHVEVNEPLRLSCATSDDDAVESKSTFEKQTGNTARLRVVVYIHRPFIYTFLFNQRAESISMAAFYRNLHTFFAPLHQPLSNSTDPARLIARIAAASSAAVTSAASSSSNAEQQYIYDLVYDPEKMTLHTSIPNIPEPGTLSAEALGDSPAWTRVEAINVHSQILTTVADTRSARAADQLERTAKTSRGWWVVWMRVNAGHATNKSTTDEGPVESVQSTSDPEPTEEGKTSSSEPSLASSKSLKNAATSQLSTTTLVSEVETEHKRVNSGSMPDPSIKSDFGVSKEAILVRRARDATTTGGSKSGTRSSSGMWATMGLGGGGASSIRTGGQQAGWGPARLAEGIGVDARRYVEGLLSLNR